MLRLAFSTVACPDWTIARVADAAARYGYDGVEFRSMGHGGSDLACDPGLSDPEKVRRLLDDAGVQPCGVASGCSFDEPVKPPVIGELFGLTNRLISAAKHHIDIAQQIGAGYVRVYGFRIPKGERRHRTIARISERLAAVCTHARHRNLSVVIENGGDFAHAADLAEIIARAGSPYLGALYDLEAAHAVGEDPRDGVRLLGRKLLAARIKDAFHGTPSRLGQGRLPARELVTALRDAGSSAWLVYTWDRAWLPQLLPADEVLPQAAATLGEWASQPAGISVPTAQYANA